MAQNSDRDFRDIITRIAQVEYRVAKIESTQQELEKSMTPGGYITEAFERLHEDIENLDAKTDELNRKIDIILQHITGVSG